MRGARFTESELRSVLHVHKRSMRESLVRVREHWLAELYSKYESKLGSDAASRDDVESRSNVAGLGELELSARRRGISGDTVQSVWPVFRLRRVDSALGA